MDKDVIALSDTFNIKEWPYELTFGNFNDQPIPPHWYNFLNYDDDDGTNIPGTTVDDASLDNEEVEDAVILDDEDVENDIIIVNDYSLASTIEPL